MFLKDFKDFAFKGNLVDIAVGIMIGGAMTTVVKSLVDNLFMPPLSLLTGRVNFADQFLCLNGDHYSTLADARKAGAPVLAYGQFLTDMVAFLVLAFVVFILTKKIITALTMRKEEAPATSALTKDQELLAEIRDSIQSLSPTKH